MMNKKNITKEEDEEKEEQLSEEEEEEEDDVQVDSEDEEEIEPVVLSDESDEEGVEEDEDEEDLDDDAIPNATTTTTTTKPLTSNKKKIQPIIEEENYDDNDEDEDNMSYDPEEDSDAEDDDNLLQKFNDNVNMKFLEDIHVETKSVNYEEMIALARVIRDKNGKIIDSLHKTLPFLTKYEKARIIGARAEQLDRGGEAFIPIDETIINGRTIALMEFEQKKIPFIIARPLSNGTIEYWHLRDLEIL